MYVILFGVGAGFIFISFFLDTLIDADGAFFSILQPKLIAVFITVMGGFGIILSSHFGTIITLIISVLSGLLIASLINYLVIKPLYKAQNTSTFDKQAIVGTHAKIISPIPQGGYGKIRYSVSGSVVTGPAKSLDGGEIKNGENVNIIGIEGSTYLVKKSYK